MVLQPRNIQMDETMPQIVPSAGFTPPCDYSNFADNFDLSLLPGGDQPLSPSTQLYPSSGDEQTQPKIFTTFYPDSSENRLTPDFQTLLEEKSTTNKYPSTTNIYLDVPSASYSPAGSLSPYSPQSLLSPNDQFTVYRQSNETNFYPSSPEVSLYTPSPNSVYSRSPCDEYIQSSPCAIKQENQTYPYYRIKEENFLSPCSFSSPTSPASCSSLSSHDSSKEVLELLENTVLDKQIKQESTVDFSSLLQGCYEDEKKEEKAKDHQLLREVLRDTSFQKKYNIKPLDFAFIGDLKMEEPDDKVVQSELMRENIEPVLNLAIEQMRKDVDNTCTALGISPDPSQWTSANVSSWIQWTSRQFGLPEPDPDQWNINGTNLLALSEDDFARRSPQGGMILHAQLEIWKAAYSDEDLSMQWLPETTSSNASSGDVSDDDDDDTSTTHPDPTKPSTSRGGSHIHLWQFLKELLASPQTHGSCIRWLDRTKGIFKIEDSVKVARLWGKRKNRPAMNYDKLSRSIRQYYKKGIMKKTERSQRLVYQFCHPYNL